jgi:hypothetical protein
MGLDDPPNYHFRRLTRDGYPLMGSSPAEEAEARQRAERIRVQAMRDHVFVGEGQYCQARLSFAPMGSAETGTITGWAGCGYGRGTHPEVPPDGVLPGNPDDCGPP